MAQKDPVVQLALETIQIHKQALVFVNAKRSAEKVAEDISKKTTNPPPECYNLADKILNAIGKPTHQCERLAKCVQKGVAFHHSGLHTKQKELIETAFRTGTIKIISCTPTLAAGVDLPAYRSIIRDVKRFGNHGMQHIPVLEFLQMAGRAGRPKYDTCGEVIVITNTEVEKQHAIDHYLNGTPEDVISKLAVEPVLRTYLLSLIATRIVKTHDDIMNFFSQTLWAHHYKDISRIEQLIDNQLKQLQEWEFIQQLDGYRATLIGKRVAELYIDPLTAHNIILGLGNSTTTKITPMSFLQLISNTLEMRPQLQVKQKEYEEMMETATKQEPYLLQKEPSMFEPEYHGWLNSIKTAKLLESWIDEKDEEWILETFDSRPGETRTKIETAKWLLYATHELATLLSHKELLKEIVKLKIRLVNGVKEELLPLVKLRGIGRTRARKLHRNGITTTAQIRTTPVEVLSQYVGRKVAEEIKKQV